MTYRSFVTHMLSENVGKELPLHLGAISQRSADIMHFASEGWNHTNQ